MILLVYIYIIPVFFFFSSRRRHTRCSRDWSSDVCSSDLRAARKLAETYFDAKQVVAKILSHALMDDESDREGLESSRLPSWTARHPFSAIKKNTTPND